MILIKGRETCHIKSVLTQRVNPSDHSLHQVLPRIVCRWPQYIWEIKDSDPVAAEVVLRAMYWVCGSSQGLKLKWGCESQSCKSGAWAGVGG